ncbi:aminodeoxychorismate synthase component I [Halosquirtibacter xylanolyticus]|uniref:aminodeoxychorismate synthase component I n=1 Tax=Halosquirtibacter xylanolyticus TaxID=3374599 RepID=UPI00374A0693|nr:aminodeoxychorismate synthase component I [Prolixibacteraceae bacterium]
MNTDLIDKMNRLGASRTPFFFMIDYKGEAGEVTPLDALDQTSVKFDFNGVSNGTSKQEPLDVVLNASPASLASFSKAFTVVRDGLLYGDSFLTNLTMKSPITLSVDLERLYHGVQAKYRLFVANRFLCFSPEKFVEIRGQKISSFPMKGTIDATIPHAEEIIMNDEKERSEHFTIVDLIRNDLSSVADHVRVKKFRYVDRVKTQNGALLQVSSHIEGELPEDYHAHLGDIFNKLLPAGSITGAPKKKTCEIIAEAEPSERGFYTGVAGVYDGAHLDSMVMIRFIAQEEDRYFFHSGGGVTAMSDMEGEYDELIKKIYVPIY